MFSETCKVMSIYVREGGPRNLRWARVKSCFRFWCAHQLELKEKFSEFYLQGAIDSASMRDIKQQAKLMHDTLEDNPLFSYSILVPVYKPRPDFLHKALESALNQSAKRFEVLVGFDGPQPQEVYDVVKELQKAWGDKIKSFQLDREKTGGGISVTTNFLSEQAEGSFLVLMDHDDWMRPDLLLRYEQMLRRMQDPQNTVLYCDEYKIDEYDQPVLGGELIKPQKPHFPFIFFNFICHCLLIPNVLWRKVGGCRQVCDQAQDFDLSLRLNLIGANFQNVPFLLYAWRVHAHSTAMNADQKSHAKEAGLLALRGYTESKKLKWTVEHGYISTTFRAVPQLDQKPKLHLLTLLPNEISSLDFFFKGLTQQDGVDFHVTFIATTPPPASILKQIQEEGAEVIVKMNGGNKARLYNQAIQESRFQDPSSDLFFLDSLVELQPGALLAMCRWIQQDSIGIVGARLNYPNGRLYHGGLDFSSTSSASTPWIRTDENKTFDMLGKGRIQRLADAVSMDCACVKRSSLKELGFLDEEVYSQEPFVYLALKFKEKNLYCFYDPFASGIMHKERTVSPHHFQIEMSPWLNIKHMQSDKNLKENTAEIC